MPKKGFKSPFTAPKKSEKDNLSGSPANISQKGALPYNTSRRNGTAMKKPETSLTAAEYEELFNSVIKSNMNNSQSSNRHSSQNHSSNDKDQTSDPELRKANSKFVDNISNSQTIKHNNNFWKHQNGKKENMHSYCHHQSQNNNESLSTTADVRCNQMKPKSLFEGNSKTQEEKFAEERSPSIAKQKTEILFQNKGKVTKTSSKCITANHLSGSHGEVDKKNIPPGNKGVHHSRPQSRNSHTCSRENTPTHHHTPCSGHSHSSHNRENHEMVHTPCKSHATARTPSTATTFNSHTLGSYGNDKNDNIPASSHKLSCSHTSCSAHSTGKEKSSQKSHTTCSLSQSYQNLSQPPLEYTLKERLEWLQKRREVGIWVQCSYSHCSKWRYLSYIHDPIDVPEKWYCRMNLDKNFNSCSVPEKGPTIHEEEDLIHNIYTAGSVVWGRLVGYPWWPAMVDDDPDTEQFYWLNEYSDIPTYYNVTFFGEEATRAWLTPNALKKFTGMEKQKQLGKTRIHGVDYRDKIEIAKQMATEALKLSIGERLRKFSFLTRFKGPFGTLRSKKRGNENYDSDSSGDQYRPKKKRSKGNENYDSDSSGDQYRPEKKGSKGTKRTKQTSVTYSPGKLHNKKRETNTFNKKTDKKPDRCLHKPQTLLNKHINSYGKKSIAVQHTEPVNKYKSISKTANAKYSSQKGSLTQCSCTQKDVDDDDDDDDDVFEISSSQDLFHSQEKRNPRLEKHINNNEEVTNITEINSQRKNNPISKKQTSDDDKLINITEITTDFNSQENSISEKQINGIKDVTNIIKATKTFNSQEKNDPMSEKQINDINDDTDITKATTNFNSQENNNPVSEKQTKDNEEDTNPYTKEDRLLKNSFQNIESPKASENASPQPGPSRCNSGNNSNKVKLPKAEKPYYIIEEVTVKEEAIAETFDAIVPSGLEETSATGDAVVPNIEDLFDKIKDGNEFEDNYDNACNYSEDSLDFEVEE